MTDTLFQQATLAAEVNPYGGEIKITTHANGKWTKRLYDRLGREVYLINSRRYWSRHEYEEIGYLGTIVSYYNSKGDWHKHRTNIHGKVVWYEREDGMWWVIADTSHRVYFNRETGQFLLGNNVMSGRKLLNYFRQRDIKVCPSVTMAIRWAMVKFAVSQTWFNMFKDEQTFWGCK